MTRDELPAITPGTRSLTNRIAFVTVELDRDALTGAVQLLDDRDDAAMLPFRRTYTTPFATTLGTILTGVNSRRHQVNTLMVPASPDGDDAEDAATIQLRTSRMSGAPFAWNRLASRNIGSLVVNFRFKPAADDERVTEIHRYTVKAKAKEEGIPVNMCTLGFVAGTIQKRPDIRCVFAAGSFVSENDESADADGGASEEDLEIKTEAEAEESGLTPAEESAGREVVHFLEGMAQACNADHSIVLLVGKRRGYIAVIGPRAAEARKGFARMITCVPTLLDLLGEHPAVDLGGLSLLGSPEQSAEDRKSGSWTLDGGPCEPPDWSDFLRRAVDGELKDIDLGLARRHLFATVDAGLREDGKDSVLEELKLLDQIIDFSPSSLRMTAMLNQAGLTEECRARIQRLVEEHPGTAAADLATLLPAWNLDSRQACEILDRYPVQTVRDRIQLAIVGRAAARQGRVDQAISTLWALFTVGSAGSQENIVLARLFMQRRDPGDAARAAIALRDMGRGQNARPEVAYLRAEALAATGSVEPAKRILEAFLKVQPAAPKITALLERISSPH